MSIFMKIIKQAIHTSDTRNGANFGMNFAALKQLVDRVTIADLNINPWLLTPEHFNRPNKAPCTYVHLYENDYFSVSIFILADSYTMPLHDHPAMHGILKAVLGNIMIRSYTRLNEGSSENTGLIPVCAEEPIHISAQTESVVLTPTKGNFHEISAVGGPAAFFDILSPPYDSKTQGIRKCSFYQRVINENFESDRSMCGAYGGVEKIYLQNIPCPSHYYCDQAEDFITGL